MHLNSLVFVPILRLRWAGMHPLPSSNMRANKKWLWRDELQSKHTKAFTENSCIKRNLSLKGPGIIMNLNQFWLRNPTQSNHSIWHLIACRWGFRHPNGRGIEDVGNDTFESRRRDRPSRLQCLAGFTVGGRTVAFRVVGDGRTTQGYS